MRVLFTATNHGAAQIGSRLIRAFEGGLASHCGVVMPDGQVIDANAWDGVSEQAPEAFLDGREVVADVTISLPNEVAAYDWLRGQVGHRYDLEDIFSFLLWRDVGSPRRHACSGLILRAMLAGGHEQIERHDRWGVRHLLILMDAMSRGGRL